MMAMPVGGGGDGCASKCYCVVLFHNNNNYKDRKFVLVLLPFFVFFFSYMQLFLNNLLYVLPVGRCAHLSLYVSVRIYACILYMYTLYSYKIYILLK